MSRLTLRATLTKLAHVSLTVLVLIIGNLSSACAAQAQVMAFDVRRVGSNNIINFGYTASWSTAGLYCFRVIEWHQGSSVTTVTSASHYSSPVNVEPHDETDAPRTKGDGNYYRIAVRVLRLIPFTVYASDEATDADW